MQSSSTCKQTALIRDARKLFVTHHSSAAYSGSILPWNDFNNYFGLTPWRLIVLGILVMILRRVPWVLALMKAIPTLPTIKEAAFAGFFGPIGVGAVYYVQVALQTLPEERVALRG